MAPKNNVETDLYEINNGLFHNMELLPDPVTCSANDLYCESYYQYFRILF